MKRIPFVISLSSVVLLASCLTVNIYFPAEEVRDAADKIVEETWGAQDSEQGEAAPLSQGVSQTSFVRELIGPQLAYAAQNINVSTPEIRAIKGAIKARSAKLKPFMNSGHIGLGKDGLLKVRTAKGLSLKDKAKVNKLVAQENNDRKRLYGEIAKANGFPKQVGEVQSIFADSWRGKAAAGWYVEQKGGGWKKK